MKIIAIAAAAALLAACGARIEGANETGGIVGFAGSNASAAFTTADQHCRQYQRAAQMIGPTAVATQLIFRCVRRDG